MDEITAITLFAETFRQLFERGELFSP